MEQSRPAEPEICNFHGFMSTGMCVGAAINLCSCFSVKKKHCNIMERTALALRVASECTEKYVLESPPFFLLKTADFSCTRQQFLFVLFIQ
jgi:hypothetical protein